MTKRQLRNILLSRLRRQTESQREVKSRLIEKKLLKQEEFVKAKRIMFFLAFDGEVNTEHMINRARDLGKEIYVPLCNSKKKNLTPCLLSESSSLEVGSYRTLEPKRKIKFPSDKLDLVIVPALGYDKRGNRLGRGKGYYDRFLKGLSEHTYCLGLAFDFQIVPDLPTNPNDIPVDKVLYA